MATHVALLRGVNVGGRNKVAMSDLRQVVSSLGHTGVRTYVQSGNVLFTAGRVAPAGLAASLAAAIASALGTALDVVVLTSEELAQVVRDNPYPGEPDPRKVHAFFLPARPGQDVAAAVARAQRQAAGQGARDSAAVAGRVVFLHTPDGFGRSKLAALLASPRGPVPGATARNWATVVRLAELSRS
jgi:uncharacterized protein (DUF1697 family)